MKQITTKHAFDNMFERGLIIAKVDGIFYLGYVDDHGLFIGLDGMSYRFQDLQEIYAPLNPNVILQYDW